MSNPLKGIRFEACSYPNRFGLSFIGNYGFFNTKYYKDAGGRIYREGCDGMWHREVISEENKMSKIQSFTDQELRDELKRREEDTISRAVETLNLLNETLLTRVMRKCKHEIGWLGETLEEWNYV